MYNEAQIAYFNRELANVVRDLQALQISFVAEGQSFSSDSRVREHLVHGVGRRLSGIRRSVENVFALFPLDLTKPLSQDAVADVQINLHAFVINLYGIFDNWAWAYVLHHDLERAIGNRLKVSLFKDATRNRLPLVLKTYLLEDTATKWHEEYAKSYRDALAHRIPPYLPPSVFTEDEGRRYNALENEKIECIKSRNWTRLDQVYAEQRDIGSPCFTFRHAFSENNPAQDLMLHPQLITDGMALVEFGKLFLKHWRERGEVQ